MDSTERRNDNTWLLQTSIFLLLSICLAFGWAYYRFGSVKRTMEFASGKILSLGLPRIEVRDAVANERREISLPIRNLGPERVRILGCSSACIMGPKTVLPFYIEQGEEKTLKMWMMVPKDRPSKLLESKVVIHTAIPGQESMDYPVSIHYR